MAANMTEASSTSRPRSTALDALRGLAVILMVIFHATYDFRMYNLNRVNFQEGFWFGLPRLIVFIFLWCVGASLQITHGEGVRWKSYNKRLLKLVALAGVISFATWWFFPETWVYMGTIHCIAGVSILALPFLSYPQARWPVLILILLGQYALGLDIAWTAQFFPHYSMDFIPVYPWFWVTLLGMLTGPAILRRLPSQFPGQALFVWPGQEALKIYLLHQPLIYGGLWVWRSLLGRF